MPIRPRREVSGRAPEKVVLEFLRAGMLEAEHLAALRIDAGHHVLDRAILSGRVHRLKDHQHGEAVGCVEQLLQRAQPRDMLCQQFLIVRLGPIRGTDDRWPFRKPGRLAVTYAELV